MQAPGLRVWVPWHKALGQQAWVEPEDSVTSTPWGRRLWDDNTQQAVLRMLEPSWVPLGLPGAPAHVLLQPY